MKTSDLKLDRYLYRKANTTSAYEQFGDDKLTNAIEANTNRPATAVAPGTVIQSTIFQSSGSNDRVEILPNDTFNVYRDGNLLMTIDSNGVTVNPNSSVPQYQPNILGYGKINSDGTPGAIFPPGWTGGLASTGEVFIVHNLNVEYGVLLTPITTNNIQATVTIYDPIFFKTLMYDTTTGLPTDTEYSFIVFGDM